MAAPGPPPVTVPLREPFTHMQGLCVALLVQGKHVNQIAQELSISWTTVRTHLEAAALKVPGDLPTMTRLLIWARGATEEVLTGSTLRASLPASFRDGV